MNPQADTRPDLSMVFALARIVRIVRIVRISKWRRWKESRNRTDSSANGLVSPNSVHPIFLELSTLLHYCYRNHKHNNFKCIACKLKRVNKLRYQLVTEGAYSLCKT